VRRVDGDVPEPRRMSAVLPAGPARPAGRGATWIAGLLVAAALWVGLAVGDGAPVWWVPLAVGGGIAVLFAGLRWPFASLLLMLASSLLLVVVRASGLRSVNLIDVLLPPVLFVSVLGRARHDARHRPEAGSLHGRLVWRERRFTNAVMWFYGLATLSLLSLARVAGMSAALDSALILSRAFQAILLYPLCMWWLRTPEHVERAWRAMFAAGVALAAANILGVAFWDVKRAGMTLFLNNPDAPLASPNEAGTATLVMTVVLMVRQAMRPNWKNVVLGLLMVLVLALTQSRSGMLAWLTFGLFSLRRVRPTRLVGSLLAVLALVPALPASFWERMVRTVTLDRGSYEAMSFFQRVYGWRVAWQVFLDHPWTGVGYLGFRYVSHAYNELRWVIGTVENFFFEVLVSMGLPGLLILIVACVRLVQLGREVRRVAPPGTLAHHMAGYHEPLLAALLVANLTGDNLVGLVSLAQLAMWTAVLVRSGHAAIAASERA
jgi:O-antigen ligase